MTPGYNHKATVPLTLRFKDVGEKDTGAGRRGVVPVILKKTHLLIRSAVQVRSVSLRFTRIMLNPPCVIETKVRVDPAVANVENPRVHEEVEKNFIKRHEVELR